MSFVLLSNLARERIHSSRDYSVYGLYTHNHRRRLRRGNDTLVSVLFKVLGESILLPLYFLALHISVNANICPKCKCKALKVNG